MKWVDTDKKKTRIYEEITIMSPFPQSARADWLVSETSRQRRGFAQILQLMMWTRTISFAVGAHRLTSPFTHAISRLDTSKGKKLIESCCIVFQLKVSQKKELQAENIGLTCSRLRYKKMQDEGLWLRLKNTCKLFNSP